jgi:ribosomal protein S12 methylthiotransferase
VPKRYFVETLGCAKNQVDSEKIAGSLLERGFVTAGAIEEADVVVVNTCAFIDAAREESVEAIFDANRHRREGARLVVTGCLAARYKDALAELIPEAEIAALGEAIAIRPATRRRREVRDSSVRNLLEMPRAPAKAPWAYVKIAEGCDRRCGFCAIPSFRGRQISRDPGAILREVERLAVKEVVLVAQDPASYGRDLHGGLGLVDLVRAVAERVQWVRLLYLYPSALSDELIETVIGTGVPYFDLSLQHASPLLLRRMRRFGDAERFLERIGTIRRLASHAALRSSFIVGYPGETEADHDELVAFLEEAQLDWAGFFAFSDETGTHAHRLDDKVPRELALERLREASEVQEAITSRRRGDLVGSDCVVLVEGRGKARSYREAPEIDGVVEVPSDFPPGSFQRVTIEEVRGPDLVARGPGTPLQPAAVAAGVSDA